MPTAVVTGANSGIGHAMAQVLIDEGYDVHACDLEPGAALQSLQCRLHVLDVRSSVSINAFAAQMSDKPIHLLLNVAGIMVPHAQDQLDTVNADVLRRTFETNTIGPLLLTQALVPNLMAASAAGESAKVGIVSSRVGSMGDNTSGGSYAYRASKAAVNSVGKSMAVDLGAKGVAVHMLHPGIVRSALNPGAQEDPEAVEPAEAAAKLWVLTAEKGLEETGRFWHREGQELPW